MRSSRPRIYLLGDAILDNFYWLSDKKRDLREEISALGYEVHNYAIDDIKVGDIINGIIPNKIYVNSRKYPYPIDKDGKIYPLKLINKNANIGKSFTSVYDTRPICDNSVKESPRSNNICCKIGNSVTNEIPLFDSLDVKETNTVIISMGGNDINAKFMGLLLGTEYFMNSILTKEFIENYEKIIETVRSNCDKIILVSIYLPYLGVGSSYGLYSAMATPVIDKWNTFIHNIGRKYNIPVLDLSKTFDIGNRSHYGTDETRASNVSNKCIAECLSYIHSHYDGYHIYFADKCSKNVTVK